MPDYLNSALQLATLHGFAVLPVYSVDESGVCSCSKRSSCTSPGKHPIPSNWQHLASPDPAVITQWWPQWPDANVGVATGTKSNVVVLDVDPRSGGLEALDALKSKVGGLPDTLTVRTGSGGFHFYFRPNDGEALKNSASKLGPGLDFKAENGFVVAPPSLHFSGNRYSWIVS